MKHELAPVAILAGGLATRLRPVTETMPKALIPVNGEPFINHQLRLLQKQGVRRVVLCLGYLGEMVEEVIGDGKQFDLTVSYSYDSSPVAFCAAGKCGPVVTPLPAAKNATGLLGENGESYDALATSPPSPLVGEGGAQRRVRGIQQNLLGTAGAIKKALPLLGDTFFVLYGDSYLTCDYRAAQAAFNTSNKQALMTIFHNEGQWDTSNVEFQHGQLLAYSKRERTERMHHIDYGLGIFNSASFDLVPANTTYDLALLYEALLKNNQLAGFEVNERFYEVGSFTGIEEFEYYLNAAVLT